jgi:acyl-CoA synthetase (AMP-forming)/AMP-acid ligase II
MSNSGPDADNFGTILRHWAGTRPERLAFRFLIDGETEGPGWTYAELDRQARRTAAALLQHASRGDRALLLYPPGLEFVAALFGCLQAGIIAVPAYPPRLERIAHSRLLLANLAQDCTPALVLTGTASAGSMQGACSGIPQLDVTWLNTDRLSGPELHDSSGSPRVDDIALLQ